MGHYSTLSTIDRYDDYSYNSHTLRQLASENPAAAAYISAIDMGLLPNSEDKSMFKDLSLLRALERSDIRKYATERYSILTDLEKEEVNANMQVSMTKIQSDCKIETEVQKCRTQLAIAKDNNSSKTEIERIIQGTLENVEIHKAKSLVDMEQIKHNSVQTRMNADVAIAKIKEENIYRCKELDVEISRISNLAATRIAEIRDKANAMQTAINTVGGALTGNQHTVELDTEFLGKIKITRY